MNKFYLLVKINNEQSPLAKKLRQKFRIAGNHHFECSIGESFYLCYNDLFELDGEYTAYARIERGTGRFEFKSDCWNVLAHYMYKKNGVLLISNDPLLLAGLVGAGISKAALWDSLIFGRPYKSGSFFEDIEKIPPFVHGWVDLETEDLATHLSWYPKWDNMFAVNPVDDLHDRMKKDFLKARAAIGDQDVALQFSGGSDSVTIFNLLRHYGIKVRCESYSTTPPTNKRIGLFYKKFGAQGVIREVEEDANLDLSVLLSGGLSPTPRFATFYSQIAPTILFDGFCIFKGDFSDAFLHPAFKSLLLMNTRKGIKDQYPEMDEELLDELWNHWNEHYENDYCDINTGEGLKRFQDYAMEYTNPNIHGALQHTALQLGHRPQSYLLGIPFMSYCHSIGFGLFSSLSIRKDFPGYRQCTSLLAGVNRNLGGDIFRHPLDKHMSFRGILEWRLSDRIYYQSHMLSGKISKRLFRKIQIQNEQSYSLSFLRDFGLASTKSRRLAALDASLGAIARLTRS